LTAGDWERVPLPLLRRICRARQLLDEGARTALIARLRGWRSCLRRAWWKLSMTSRLHRRSLLRRSWRRLRCWAALGWLARKADASAPTVAPPADSQSPPWLARPWKLLPLLSACAPRLAASARRRPAGGAQPADTLALRRLTAGRVLDVCHGDVKSCQTLLGACNHDAGVLLKLVRECTLQGGGVQEALARVDTTSWKASMVRVARNHA
jgi:hypothetical protein